MRQILLAAALITVPVVAFTGFNVYTAGAHVGAPAAGLGDLSAFSAIITDVQATAAKGELAGAKTRIKDFELTWDDNEKGLRPLDTEKWHLVDDAADAAFTALRAGSPDPAGVGETLTALQAALASAGTVTK